MTNIKLWTKDFILLSISNFCMFLAFYFLIPTLPLFSINVLKMSNSEIGLILSIYTITALVIRPFIGIGLDVWGRRALLLISFAFFVLIFPIYLLISGFVSFIILRAVHGLSWGGVTTSGSTTVIDIIPAKRRGEGIGYYGLFITLAMALGPFLGIWLVREFSFKGLFWSSFLLSFTGFLLIFFVKFPTFTVHLQRRFSVSNLFEKSAIPSSINLLFTSLTYGGLLSFLSIYAEQTGIGNSGLFFMVMAIGIGLMRIISGKAFDRKGPGFVMIIGLCALVIGFPMLAFSTHIFLFLASAFILGLGNGVVMPTFQAMVNNQVHPQQRGVANSTLFTAFDLGIGIGMALTGILSEKIPLSEIFLSYSLLSIISLLIFHFYVNKKYQNGLKSENILKI